MSQLGFGVMIQMFGGNEKTTKLVKNTIGKKIKSAKLDDDSLILKFEDGSGIELFDDGQSCCEYRHMETDDNLNDFVGATLNNIEVKDGPTQDVDGCEIIECQFLELQTSKGSFLIKNYNEHNGYYGGFYVVAKELEQ